MGATCWIYAVPYQPSIEQALQALRLDVFRQGDYTAPTKAEVVASYVASLRDPLPPGLDPDEDANLLAQWQSELAWLQRLPEPTTEEERMAEVLAISNMVGAGTHSILDMQSVGSTPGFGTVAPLSEDELISLFGTTEPERDAVAEKRDELFGRCERWEGIYVIVYKDGHPDGILFVGCSGD